MIFQLFHDGCTLKNKDKCQAFGIQFVDRRFRYNNSVALSFSKALSIKADKVAELAQDA